MCYIVAGEIEDVADKVIETLSLSIEKTKELAAEGKVSYFDFCKKFFNELIVGQDGDSSVSSHGMGS